MPLWEFAATVEQMANVTFAGLPEGFVQNESAHASLDGVKDFKVKQHLIMGGGWNPLTRPWQ